MNHPTRPHNALENFLQPVPLIAILRGIETGECAAIVDALYEAGLRCMEIPLNSPHALISIELLARRMPADCLIGAGTVLSTQSVSDVANAGGRLIVMPHCDPLLIDASRALDLICVPGVATISEAFTAIAHDAHAVKLFPAESVTPTVLKSWRAVLPQEALCLPVGGIQPEHMQSYFQNGANGFGLGTALFKPGMSASEVGNNARRFITALRET